MSLYSYDTERDAAAFIREASGRRYNNRNELYVLPSDQSEFLRHDKQHRMLELAVGGLYPSQEQVEAILAPRFNERPAILDLGAGSGIWCIQMALKFPHCDVVGVDLVANASRETPPNCRFEFDDVCTALFRLGARLITDIAPLILPSFRHVKINLGLSHFHGRMDMVHSRAVVNGIRDFHAYVNEIVACLKPGGIAILAEGDWRPYREDKQTPHSLADFATDGGSWWGRVCHEAFELMKSHGSSIEGADEVERGLHHPLIHQNQTATFFVPLGPWATGNTPENTASLVEQGRLMGENEREFAGALSLLFEEAGKEPEITAAWLANVDSSLVNGNTREYVKYRYAWGIKRLASTSE